MKNTASDVISKIKQLPESDFSEEGQLKLLRLCGNSLGLFKAVEWMQKYNQKCLQKIYIQKELDKANKILIDNGLKENPIKSNISRKA